MVYRESEERIRIDNSYRGAGRDGRLFFWGGDESKENIERAMKGRNASDLNNLGGGRRVRAHELRIGSAAALHAIR